MAKYYGKTPSELLNRPLGEWSLDWEIWQADLEQQELERAKAQAEAEAAAARSRRT